MLQFCGALRKTLPSHPFSIFLYFQLGLVSKIEASKPAIPECPILRKSTKICHLIPPTTTNQPQNILMGTSNYLPQQEPSCLLTIALCPHLPEECLPVTQSPLEQEGDEEERGKEKAEGE